MKPNQQFVHFIDTESSIKYADFYYHSAKMKQHYNTNVTNLYISSIQILVDDSLSFISTDDIFSENYQRQSANHYIDYIPLKERKYILKSITDFYLQKNTFHLKHNIQKKDNSITKVSIYGNFLTNQNHTAVCNLLLIDEKNQKQLQQHFKNCSISIAETKSDYHNIKSNCASTLEKDTMPILFEYNEENNILLFSDVLKQNCYFPSQPLQKTTLIHHDDKQYFYTLLKYCQHQRETTKAKIRLFTSENKYQYFYITLYALQNHNYKKYISVYAKITPAFIAHFTHQNVKRDSITNLYHRDFIKQQVNLLLQNYDTKQSALILIHLSNLKNIYDSIGTPLGNMVLNDIVKRIKNYFHQTDIIARYSHDKIIIYTPNIISKTTLKQNLNDMKDSFHVTYGNHQNAYTPNIYVGISFYPHDGNCYQSLLRYANKALLHAKQT